MRMVGISSTSALRSASCLVSWLACSRVRVTTIRFPNNGRFSYQFSLPRSFTTSPMMVSAGGLSPAFSTASAIVASVPSTACCRPVVPQRTTATGVFSGIPFATSCDAISRMRDTPMSTTFVPGILAICAQSRLDSSLSGSSWPVITV